MTPHEHITVDKVMVPFEGHLGFKQFMKDKPVKSGIKLWVSADAVTAYCYNLEVYMGKHGQQVNRLMGLSAWVVTGLTEPIHNFGQIIHTDNFYTSPIVGKYLASQKTYLCGTMWIKCLGCQLDFVKTNEETWQLPGGSSDWHQCQDSSMLATAWKDKRTVYYLLAAHTPHEEELQTITREQRDSTEIELPCLPTVAAYARYMNRLDKLDQTTVQNKSKKCMKWYRKGETKLMKTSLYNAYVINGHVINHKVGNVVKHDFVVVQTGLGSSTGWESLCGEISSWQTTQCSQWKWPMFGSYRPLARERRGQRLHLWGVQCMTQASWMTEPRCVLPRQPMQVKEDHREMWQCNVNLCCSQHNCFKVSHTRVTFVWHFDTKWRTWTLTCIPCFSFVCLSWLFGALLLTHGQT